MRPLVASFWAGSRYAAFAAALARSCSEQGADYLISERPDMGVWQLNCGQKPDFLLRCFDDVEDRDLLWVDADARLVQPIDPLGLVECDVGVHRFKNREVLSGTVLLKRSVKTFEFLERWRNEVEATPMEWDQRSLERALQATRGLRVHWLDAQWCYIHDLSQRYYRRAKPAIVHYQASRERT